MSIINKLDKFWHFWGSCTDSLLAMRAKFGVLQHRQGLHLQAKFHLNVFIVSASGGQNPQFWANFGIFGGSCTDPLLPMRANLVCYSRPTVYVYLGNFVSTGLFCRPVAAKKNNFFAVFWSFFGLRHLAMSAIGSSLRKLNTVAQLQTFPYPTASKLILYSNAFMAKSDKQSLTFKSVTDRQTDRQTKNWNVFGHPGGGWNPSSTKLGMVIEDLKHVLARRKLLGVWRTDSRVRWKFGGDQTPQLKTPITPQPLEQIQSNFNS